jgi:lysozyme family protein
MAKADGRLGPATMAALAACDTADVIRRMCDARMGFLRSLKTFDTFGKGWSRRVAEVEHMALEWAASGPMVDRPPPPQPPSLGLWASIMVAFGRLFRKGP